MTETVKLDKMKLWEKQTVNLEQHLVFFSTRKVEVRNHDWQKKKKIDSGYLNSIIKGRKPGSTEVREKIASHFGLEYEEMLSLGRWLLSDYPGELWEKGDWSYAIEDSDFYVDKDGCLYFADKGDPNKCFIIAMHFLLKKMGPESRQKLISNCDIAPESLDKILKGDFLLFLIPNEKKAKIEMQNIASFFNLSIKSMISLGRWLLYGHPGEAWQPTDNIEDRFPPTPTETSPEKPGKDTLCTCNQPGIYQLSARDKKDKNMHLIITWINQQDDPDDYWAFLKILFSREEPEFRDWVKKQSSGDIQDRLPENKSVVGE